MKIIVATIKEYGNVISSAGKALPLHRGNPGRQKKERQKMKKTNQLPAIGTTIEATRPAESFYKRVRGIVTAHRNGRVKIDATEVISKWDTEWSKHPTSCSMGVFLREIVG